MKAATYRILVMGVSGSGKSHVGRLLARRLGIDFIDGDDHHSPASIDKMANGIPLDDADRREWLETLAGCFGDYRHREASVVIACSALKRRYRDTLRGGDGDLAILFLEGDGERLRQRLGSREEHFFRGEAMLVSQLCDLEPPGHDEAVVVDIGQTPEQIVEAFLLALKER